MGLNTFVYVHVIWLSKKNLKEYHLGEKLIATCFQLKYTIESISVYFLPVKKIYFEPFICFTHCFCKVQWDGGGGEGGGSPLFGCL